MEVNVVKYRKMRAIIMYSLMAILWICLVYDFFWFENFPFRFLNWIGIKTYPAPKETQIIYAIIKSINQVGDIMSKVQILVHIKNNDQEENLELNAILQDDVIKYKENETTTLSYNYEQSKLTRETDELRITYFFDENKNTIGTIYIKEMNREIKVNITTKKIIKEGNNIKIEFIIENNRFLYEIEVLK